MSGICMPMMAITDQLHHPLNICTSPPGPKVVRVGGGGSDAVITPPTPSLPVLILMCARTNFSAGGPREQKNSSWPQGSLRGEFLRFCTSLQHRRRHTHTAAKSCAATGGHKKLPSNQWRNGFCRRSSAAPQPIRITTQFRGDRPITPQGWAHPHHHRSSSRLQIFCCVKVIGRVCHLHSPLPPVTVGLFVVQKFYKIARAQMNVCSCDQQERSKFISSDG